MGSAAASASLALAALVLLASQAAALQWKQVGGVPADARATSDSSISMWGATGKGLFTALLPKGPAQYYTKDHGSTWTKVSNLDIDNVYMTGPDSAVGVLVPTDEYGLERRLYKWQKNKWTELKPPLPSVSGATEVRVQKVEVSADGKTVHILGTVKFGWFFYNTQNNKQYQCVWRCTPATGKFLTVRSVNFPKDGATMTALAVASDNLLWVGWDGNRIDAYNGKAWTTIQQPSNGSDMDWMRGMGPGNAWSCKRFTTSKPNVPWYRALQLATDKKVADKLVVDISWKPQLISPSPSVAMVVALDDGWDNDVLRLWRWDRTAGKLKSWANVTVSNVPRDGHSLAAASDKWAVLAYSHESAAAGKPLVLDGKVWNGQKWSIIATWKQKADVAIDTLVALPGSTTGSALIALTNSGSSKGYGLWRLVA